MTIPEPIKKFITWIQGFDHRILRNEDDVKEKFILPMFHYLCYPEKCHHEYPLKTSKSEKYGNSPENSHIYYIQNDIQQQNTGSSLVFIKVIEPQTAKLNDAIEKDNFYINQFNTLFFIITNGYDIQVFECLHGYKNELIFDINIDKFKSNDVASKFYNQLNFDCVKNIGNTANILKNTKYNLIEKLIRHHPDLQDFLEKYDFEPCAKREGYRLIVVRKKVAIACNLPKAFGEGNCEIQFSSLILRGLKIYLNHQDILGQLMTGLPLASS